MKFFKYDNVNEQVTLNQEEILLIKEFSTLMEDKRNKCPEDKTGKNKLRAYKEFAYIYLFFDWESPLSNFSEQDRNAEALNSSGLTEIQLSDPDFKNACNKYNELQESSVSIRLLKAAMMSVETVIYYLEHVDVNERNPADGKPVYKTKDLIAEIKGCKDLIDGLHELEKQVKKELETDSGKLRGDVEAGFYD